MIIKVQDKDERFFPQNTKSYQSKTRHLHSTRRTIHIGIHKISQKPESTPLNVIHPFWITNQKSTILNNMKWNSSKSDNRRGPQGRIEVK